MGMRMPANKVDRLRSSCVLQHRAADEGPRDQENVYHVLSFSHTWTYLPKILSIVTAEVLLQ
jgi:hypothetical protein